MRNLLKKVYMKCSISYRKQTQILETLIKVDVQQRQLSDMINSDAKRQQQIEDKIRAMSELQRNLFDRITNIDHRSLSLEQQLSVANQTINMNSIKLSNISDGLITVLFLVHNIEVWSSLHGVYQIMADDSKFRVIVASCNRRYPCSEVYQNESLVHERLLKLKIPHIRFIDEDSYRDLDIIKRMRPDVIFRQSGWDADVPPAFSVANLRFARLYSVSYFILPMTAHSFSSEDSTNYFIRRCETVFVLNQDVLELYKQKDTSGLHVVASGHPRIDEILTAKPLWPIKSGNKFRILWSAHHAIFGDWNNFGVFLDVYPTMLELAKKHPDMDFLFSMHPGLRGSLERVGRENPQQRKSIDEFFEWWQKLPNTGILTDGEYISPMKASDILIIDGLSLLMEYQLTQKPIIWLEKEGHSEFNEIGKKLLRGVNKVDYHDAKAIENKILAFKNGQQDEKAADELANYKFLTANCNAAQKIVECIKQDFDCVMN